MKSHWFYSQQFLAMSTFTKTVALLLTAVITGSFLQLITDRLSHLLSLLYTFKEERAMDGIKIRQGGAQGVVTIDDDSKKAPYSIKDEREDGFVFRRFENAGFIALVDVNSMGDVLRSQLNPEEGDYSPLNDLSHRTMRSMSNVAECLALKKLNYPKILLKNLESKPHQLKYTNSENCLPTSALENDTAHKFLPIRHNVNLRNFTTMKTEAVADILISVGSLDELKAAVQFAKDSKKELTILGGGSNTLFSGDFRGIVLQNNLKGVEILNEDEDHVMIKSWAGENWHELVEYTVSQNWSGIESLALIPGTVGAAPVQNIGAYRVELKDVFIELEAFLIEENRVKTFGLRECEFGYRDSIFKRELKGKTVIISVTVQLSKRLSSSWQYPVLEKRLDECEIADPTILDVFKAVVDVRRSRIPDPDEIGSNGSFFKNPVIPLMQFHQLKQHHPEMPHHLVTDLSVKVPAGWLIENAGWKGYRHGDAGVYTKHALILVNYGNASGAEIVNLSKRIQDDVERKFGIQLVREVNVV